MKLLRSGFPTIWEFPLPPKFLQVPWAEQAEASWVTFASFSAQRPSSDTQICFSLCHRFCSQHKALGSLSSHLPISVEFSKRVLYDTKPWHWLSPNAEARNWRQQGRKLAS